jgi:hypothetical protein
MEFTKGFLRSKTVWAGIGVVLASGAGLIGYHISAQDQAEIAVHVSAISTAVLGLVAIYGRVVASKRIG